MKFNRGMIKQQAKQVLRESQPRPWLVTLVYLLIANGIVFLAGMLGPNPFRDVLRLVLENGPYIDQQYLFMYLLESIGGFLGITMLLSVVATLCSMVLQYGYCGYCLKLFRRQGARYRNLFDGFPNAFRVIGAGVMVSVFTFLWSLILLVPSCIILGLTFVFGDAAAMGICLAVLLVIMMVAMVVISLRYAMTPYIMMERPETGVFEAISRSKEMMRGNKGRLFVLDLSFVGWYLLTALIIYIMLFIGIMIAGFVGYMGANDMAVVGAVLITIGFGLLGLLISLPLNLWLTAYVGAAGAGFYDAISGGNEPPEAIRDEYRENHWAPPAPPVNPVAPNMEEPRAPQVPQAPQIPQTPQIPQAPQAPEPPQNSEQPQAPQTPDGPQNPPAGGWNLP